MKTGVAAGRIESLAEFRSERVSTRRIDVRLPVSYDDDSERRWPVLYMQDGQNLFDPETSFAGVAWEVDRTLSRLSREEGLRDAIVVGIWNTPERIPEYMPERPLLEHGTEAERRRFAGTYGSSPKSDAYLAFIALELKPFIDREYRTRPGAADTLVAGSSMGGLVSLYALCEYPQTFGAAGCLSTSWTVAGRIMLPYLRERMPHAGFHRVYFDYGVEAQIARYESLHRAAGRVLQRSGYRRGIDWLTERFPGQPHSESAWRDRFDVCARFLLGPHDRS